MPLFSYVAKDIQGIYHRGEVETADEHQVAALLRRKKLIVISLKPKGKQQMLFYEKFFNRVSFNEVVVITRQLATMIEAGLVLSEAIDILEEQQTNKRLQLVLINISNDIKGGLDFATAIDKYPDVFPGLYAKLVRAGQASGKLDSILLELAQNLEKEREFKGKVRGAMIYPLVVLTMMLGVMLLMIFFVMPKLLGMFKDSGMALPLPTQIIVAFSNFMINYWWAILFLSILGVTILKRYVATPDGRMVVDRIILRTPVLGKITVMVIMTNFTRTFALLVSSGISILESIKISSEVVGNMVYKDGLDIAYRGVERGLTFSSQLMGLPAFPRIVGQMAKTGEETGKLDDVLFKLANYFESESDENLKNVTTLIEPLILLILGIGVAFLVISIILPIYQLTTNVQ